MNNNQPLHQNVHWRTIRTILDDLCTYEDINPNNYNFNNINCYSVEGYDLDGSNVSYNNIDASCSCWLSDNIYEVFEAKSTNNVIPYTGEFLTLAYNVTRDFWTLALMKHDLVKSYCNEPLENINYTPLGEYSISGSDQYNISIFKEKLGSECSESTKNNNIQFDSLCKRRKSYGASRTDSRLLSEGKLPNKKIAIDSKPVSIYKKKKKY